MDSEPRPDAEPESQPSTDEPRPPAEGDADERGRSTIVFPYAWLGDAERVAKELHNFGGSATPEGIANAFSQKPRSGTFRQKLSAARIFGLITTRPNQVSITRLGRSIIDPERQAKARVEAFLNPPLYKAIFQKYQGDLLPPVTTLDAEMVELGVSPKQAALARQIMFRSAERAGFFARGPNRLVAPDLGAEPPPQQTEPAARSAPVQHAGALPAALEVPMLVMLESGESWSPQQTHDYVDALRKMRRALVGT
jgi:hypothetical protein